MQGYPTNPQGSSTGNNTALPSINPSTGRPPAPLPSPHLSPPQTNPTPQIAEFIKKHAKQIKGLTVRESIGSYPRLVLSGGPEGARASVRIDNWKRDTIAEYLRDKLAGGGAEGAPASS